jgi:DNA ligase 1
MNDKSPMTSSQVVDAIAQIAGTSSTKAKQELLAGFMQDPTFKRVAIAAYDVGTTYGIADKTLAGIHVAGSAPGRDFDDGTWALLDGLARRVITGHEAVNAISTQLQELNVQSSGLLRQILLQDLRAGFTDTMINKVAPGSIAEYPYMRCSLPDKSNMDKWDWSKGVISQEKADGMFCNANCDAQGYVWLTTRQGSPFPREAMGVLIGYMETLLQRDTQTHGELLVFRDGAILPREVGNGILNKVLKGGELEPGCVVRFFAWDNIPLAAVKPKGKDERPYKLRLATLLNHLCKQIPDGDARLAAPVRVIDTRIVRSLADAKAHARELQRQDKEGTIVSNPDAPWRDGTSKDKVKLKVEADCELIVIAKTEGKGKNADTFGALTCRSACGLLQVDVPVPDPKDRKALHEDPTTIGSIITTRFNDIMEPTKEGALHSLFLPRFTERRLDKSEADSLARIREAFKAAVEFA